MANENYICKGFFANEIKLESIVNEDYDMFTDENNYCPEVTYDDASVFMSGSCDIFAHALANILDYHPYKLYDDNNNCIHVFCITDYTSFTT